LSAGPSLSRTSIAAFSVGSIGTGVFATVPSVLLLYYCTEILDLSSLAAGAIVFAPKIFALVWDPLVGLWSDRTRSPIGRRGPFLLAGALGVSIAFTLVFQSTVFPQALAALAVGTAYLMLCTAYSIFAVPYLALPAEMTDDTLIRQRIVAWRMAFALFGVLLGAGGAPYLVEHFGGGRDGYAAMAMALSGVCLLAMLVSFVGTRRYDKIVAAEPARASRESVGIVLKNRAFVSLGAGYVALLSATGVLSSLAPYFIVQTLNLSDSDVGAALGTMLLAAIVSIPAWTFCAARLGAKLSLIVATLCYGSGALTLASLSGPEVSAALLFFFAGIGIGFGGIQVIPFASVAEIAYQAARVGARAEGLFTGAWTSLEKLGLALGPAISAVMLALLRDQVRFDLLIGWGPLVLSALAALIFLLGPPPTSRMSK
jgi:glycoside/pentoside/hexuronide:cation symporter, GPH family